MDLMQKDKGEGKPVFLQSLTRDKVGVVQLIMLTSNLAISNS